MKDVVSCTRASSDIISSHLNAVRSSMTTRAAFPALYVQWMQLMLDEGSAIFRIFALMAHTLFDEKLKTILFHGERPENVIAFTERLQDRIYGALLGRKSDGTTYTQAEINASRCQRAADITCHMQDYYLSM